MKELDGLADWFIENKFKIFLAIVLGFIVSIVIIIKGGI